MDPQNVFWTSHVPSSYILCPGGDLILTLKSVLDADLYASALVWGVSKNCFLISTINFSL